MKSGKKTTQKNYAKIKPFDSSQDYPAVNAFTTETFNATAGFVKPEAFSVLKAVSLGQGYKSPVALAEIKQGDTLLYLGSNEYDYALATEKVGKTGKVIGVDASKEMVDSANENAKKNRIRNLEFRLGENENLPVADESVDVVVSDCDIQNKKRVFKEVFRVLKSGGSLMICDRVLIKPLSTGLSEGAGENGKSYIAYVPYVELEDEYLQELKETGFQCVKIVAQNHFHLARLIKDQTLQDCIEICGFSVEILQRKMLQIQDSVAKIKVSAFKP